MASSIDLRQQSTKKRDEAFALQNQAQQKLHEAGKLEQQTVDALAQEQKNIQSQQLNTNAGPLI